jgi:hypothetical protein
MSGDAFVVGDGFIVDERAVREIGSGDHDAAGTLAIGCASDVVGRGGRLEGGYRFDRDGRFRKQGEKLGSFGSIWAM